MKTCNPYTWSALAPIKATPEMTHPVGQRDGQLFTAPTGGTPDPSEALNGYILQVVAGEWQATNALAEIGSQVNSNRQAIAYLQTRISTVENTLDGMGAAIAALNGEVV